VITQEDLRRYRQTSHDHSELERRHRQMREALLKRVEAGEPVQLGGLALTVRPVQQRRITYDHVGRLLGPEWVTWFQQHLPPTTVNYVKVEPTAD
jgi:hypothetical protein